MPAYNECSIYDAACRNGSCSHIHPKPTVDQLISKYAEILKAAKVGDYTYNGILAEFARELREVSEPISGGFRDLGTSGPTQPYEPISAELRRGPGTNTGHGWVWERPDRQKATSCGYGEGKCRQCSEDWKKFGYGLRDSS
jgi:hypothetical protein